MRTTLLSGGRCRGRSALLVAVAVLVVTSPACGDPGTSEPSTRSVEDEAVATSPPGAEVAATNTTGAPAQPTATTSTASTPTTTTATTTSAPSATSNAKPGRIGYRVVGVAADDVLNVRAGASVQEPIVGTLPADATGVLVTDTTWTDVWWRVLLDDDVTGWVNSTYLAVDEAWTAPFDELPCAAGDVAWGETQVSPEPTPASDAVFVWGYDYLESAECDRLVIRLATRPEDATVVDWQASRPAGTVPGGVQVSSGSNRVTVVFPEDFFDVRLGMARVDYGSVELFATAPLESPRKRAIELLYPSERIGHARFLDHPARIVVDIRPAPDPTGIDYSPHLDGLFVLTEPALWDGSIAGTEQPLTITGMGRPYEAQGYAAISRIDGGTEPVEALWSGGVDCTDDFGAPTARGDAYCFYATYEVWGEFSLTIDELPPGRYQLALADECAEGDEATCAAAVFKHDFTVE